MRTTDPKLRTISKPVQKVDKKLLKLLRDLEDTVKAQKDPEGIGLAAPQIGEFVCVFVIRDKHQIKTFINPEIVKSSKKTNDPKKKPEEEEYFMEGCLSLPHYYGPVERALSVTVKYQVPQLQPTAYGSTVLSSPSKDNLHTLQKTFRGFIAQVIQHEIDHLKGRVFTERLIEQKRKLFKLYGDHWDEVELP